MEFALGFIAGVVVSLILVTVIGAVAKAKAHDDEDWQ